MKKPKFFYAIKMDGPFSPLADQWAEMAAGARSGDSGYMLPDGPRDLEFTFPDRKSAERSRALFKEEIARLWSSSRSKIKLGPIKAY